MTKRERHYFLGGIQVGFGICAAALELYIGAPVYAALLLVIGFGLGLRKPSAPEQPPEEPAR